jgi:hypothetical protein
MLFAIRRQERHRLADAAACARDDDDLAFGSDIACSRSGICNLKET